MEDHNKATDNPVMEGPREDINQDTTSMGSSKGNTVRVQMTNVLIVVAVVVPV